MAETKETGMLRSGVWLSMVFGAGSGRLVQYLRKYETPENLYHAMQAGTVSDLPAGPQKQMAKHSISEADSMVYYCRQHGISLLPADSPDYPQMLLDLAVPPMLLTAYGDLSALRMPMSVAVVGTRRPAEYTERVTVLLRERPVPFGVSARHTAVPREFPAQEPHSERTVPCDCGHGGHGAQRLDGHGAVRIRAGKIPVRRTARRPL